MNRSGVLAIEADLTGGVMERGKLEAVAWCYRGRVDMWRDGDQTSAIARLRVAAARMALVVGYDVHESCAHLSHRLGIWIPWPRLSLREVTGMDPYELVQDHKVELEHSDRNLTDDPDLALLVRRLRVMQAVWEHLRSRR